MKTIDQLIQEKREQVERLNAQIEVLEELAIEARGPSARRPRGPGRPPRGRRRGGRAGRGANQQRVLKVLSVTPMRGRDIAVAAKLTAPAVSQVLMGLKKTGAVEQTGRGLYRLAEKVSASAPPARQRKTAAAKKKRRRSKAASKSKTSAPSSSRQEASASPAGQ